MWEVKLLNLPGVHTRPLSGANDGLLARQTRRVRGSVS